MRPKEPPIATILILGAAGRSGAAATTALLCAGHRVVAGVRDPDRATTIVDPRAQLATVDVFDPDQVHRAARDCDGAINAVRIPGSIPPELLVRQHDAISTGLGRAGVEHVVIVGGAGSLRLAGGRRFWQHPGFPRVTLPRGVGHARLRDHLEDASYTGTGWTYLIPPPQFDPDGAPQGRYTAHPGSAGEEAHLGRSVAYADFALAMADHAVTPTHGTVALIATHPTPGASGQHTPSWRT